MHQLKGLPNPVNSFVVQRMLKGVHNITGKPDVRLPITPTILQTLVSAIPTVVTAYYDQFLLKAMVTLSFFGFLRVGEITAKGKPDLTRSHGANIIQLSNVVLKKTSGILLTLKHFKHHTSHRPLHLQIPIQKFDLICPVWPFEHTWTTEVGHLVLCSWQAVAQLLAIHSIQHI